MSAPAPSVFSDVAKSLLADLKLAPGKANLDVFAQTLLELARADRNLVVVTSDSRGSGKLGPFGQELPHQIVEVGIAEQNLVGVAAGLAASGKRVFAVSPACFLTARSLEQIKNDVCYSDHPVTLVGISAGVSYGALGSTHHSLHDLAALRAINNLDLIVPADNAETAAAVRAAAVSPRPVYLRFGKAAQPTLGSSCDPRSPLPVGRAIVLRSGSDLTFVATGETVVHALLAAEFLGRERKLSCGVISMPCIRPFDHAAIAHAAKNSRAVITCEEHSVHGGLGEACASSLLQAGLHPRFRIVGIPDEYTVTGAQADIFRHYGLSLEGLRDAALACLGV